MDRAVQIGELMGYDDVKAVAKDLTKLALNGSPYWRVGVTASILVIGGVVYWGFHNYARADSVDEKIEEAVKPIRKDLASIKLERLTDSILAAKRDQCDAVRDGRNAAAWTKRLSDLSDQYFNLVGRSYPMPMCSEV